ncbi:hypothetical protein [Shinella sp. M27]|uniref:hypothetical protein n=1 Tax=Shinella sp. M27 TaxID=3368614 RepID=UPI003BA2A725
MPARKLLALQFQSIDVQPQALHVGVPLDQVGELREAEVDVFEGRGIVRPHRRPFSQASKSLTRENHRWVAAGSVSSSVRDVTLRMVRTRVALRIATVEALKGATLVQTLFG